MDFVLDSDSDSGYSSQTIKSRPMIKYDEAANTTTTTTITASTRTTINSSMSKAELMAAYKKLETPKASSREFIPQRSREQQQQARHSFVPNLDYDQSKERMKVSSIIDSETAEDTENLFLMPITMQTIQSQGEKQNVLNSQFFKGIPKSETTIDLEFSEISDGEDLLAEFSSKSDRFDKGLHRVGERSSLSSSTSISLELSPQRSTSNRPNFDSRQETPNFGQLLQLDSGTEQVTPKYKSIRDELDQSKTRFRQSITDLLNSSPISAVALEKAPIEFKELVKMGSKLSEHVLGEIEIIEKRNSNSNNHPVIIEPLTAMGAEVLPPPPNQPRKLTTVELLTIAREKDREKEKEKDNPFNDNSQSSSSSIVKILESKVKVGDDDGDEEFKLSNWSLLLRRIWWALFVIIIILIMDTFMQVMSARQQAALPLLDLEGLQTFMDSIDDFYYQIASWVTSKWSNLGGIRIPH